MPMASNKHKKLTLTEDDVCSLLQRYTAGTILSVLREVAKYPEVNINWDVLVANTSSGIKSARELQQLWRHLAYRHPLSEHKFTDTAPPLDDDSDLELEVEVFPPPTTEAAMEAANCAKVLANASASEYGITNNVNVKGVMPNGNVAKLTSENLPASSSRPSSNVAEVAAAQSEGVDVTEVTNNSRKKRKWTDEEDLKLIAGVQKCGDNWAMILKEGQWGRTASQLSQRWQNMKKQGSVNVGAATSTGPQPSRSLMATNRAIDIAVKDNSTAVGNGAIGTNHPAKPMPINVESPVASSSVAAQRQVSQAANTFPKAALRPPVKKAKPPSISDTIQATAVAPVKKVPTKLPSISDTNQVSAVAPVKKVQAKPPSISDTIQATTVAPVKKVLPKPPSISDTIQATTVAPVKKVLPKPPSISDTIQATAVAAGARIVSPSDADALRNYASVHFFRTSTAPAVPNKDNTAKASQQAQLPKPKT